MSTTHADTPRRIRTGRRPPPAPADAPWPDADVDGERAVWFGAPEGDLRFDGVWWRGPADAETELAWLVPRVQRHLDERVLRVALGMGDWAGPHPSRVWEHDVLLRVEWFATQDPRTVSLRTSTGRPTLVLA